MGERLSDKPLSSIDDEAVTYASAPVCKKIDRTEDNTAPDDDADDNDYLSHRCALEGRSLVSSVKAEPATPPLKAHSSIDQRAVKTEPASTPFAGRSVKAEPPLPPPVKAHGVFSLSLSLDSL